MTTTAALTMLLVLHHRPYAGDQVESITWNALRLAQTALGRGLQVRIHLMEEAVELAKEGLEPPRDGVTDMVGMLRELIAKGAEVSL